MGLGPQSNPCLHNTTWWSTHLHTPGNGAFRHGAYVQGDFERSKWLDKLGSIPYSAAPKDPEAHTTDDVLSWDPPYRFSLEGLRPDADVAMTDDHLGHERRP